MTTCPTAFAVLGEADTDNTKGFVTTVALARFDIAWLQDAIAKLVNRPALISAFVTV